MSNQQIANQQTLAEFAEHFQQSVLKLRDGYALIQEAHDALMATALMDVGTSLTLFPRQYFSTTDDALEEVLRSWKKSAWWRLIEVSQVQKILTTKRWDELYQRIDSNETPEINLETIIELLGMFLDNKNSLAREAVIEAYDLLRPQRTGLKTNRPFLADKVILTEYVEACKLGSGCWKVRSFFGRTKEQNLQVIDRAFHLLAGKGIPDGYKSPLIDAINSTHWSRGESTGSTDYFSYKLYRNGNIHLTFTRADLVNNFNAIAGGAMLHTETV